MGESEFVDLLDSLLSDADLTDEYGVKLARTSTFEQSGLMTSNKGLMVTMADGSEFQVTVVLSKQGG